MPRAHDSGELTGGRTRAGVLVLAAILALAAGGCSPEDDRARGGGLGADVGNTRLPIQMHGGRGRNNPSFQVPLPGAAPRDARGEPGWWADRDR